MDYWDHMDATVAGKPHHFTVSRVLVVDANALILKELDQNVLQMRPIRIIIVEI